MEKIVLSGMRPTGRLHLGHLLVLENWVKLQEEAKCFYMIADWHALTTEYENTDEVLQNIEYLALDFLAAGIDPEKSALFVQSEVKEHAELALLFGMFTPLSWLERVPTYKDQKEKLGEMGKDLNTYGFLGYPLLQAADILIYRANLVPVGEDQLPHLELTREVARRFNYLYGSVFPEPQAVLHAVPLLPGIDGRKMSKSYKNEIALSSTPEEVSEQVRNMITDPARVRKTDPGHPEVCVVHTYYQVFYPEKVTEIEEQCRTAGIGCVACKKQLALKINEILEPLRERREEFLKGKKYLEILAEGQAKASRAAKETMREVREKMKLR
ncbi:MULTISPECIES: tryptophan--tRNA ligase [Carboxydothermus]|uniref:Tryptophan--tRNA ligase n=2 Tax=Carboxydothermus TaxID=129957 RepID=Q3AAR8_CARHZ|nr:MULTISPECIES: tryptophan--tRNA ligase [Carboxydothermus]ABB14843.1 tryptophanyl-tRNA synthetase [Carboxydothermus hydrogenoformans Z-2901]NYE58660.1 tryptophanyl-tRNA synthetase [Carboxydothermus ferrireducens DSM 11255]